MVLLCFESRLVQLPLIAMRVQTLERSRADEAVLDKGVEESLIEGIDCRDFRHLEDPLGQIREVHLRQVIPRQEKDRCYLIVEGNVDDRERVVCAEVSHFFKHVVQLRKDVCEELILIGLQFVIIPRVVGSLLSDD